MIEIFFIISQIFIFFALFSLNIFILNTKYLRLIKPLLKQATKRIKGLLGKKQGERFKGLKRKKKLISESNADD